MSKNDEKMKEEDLNYCMECGKKLDLKNNEYHRKWVACDQYCYGKFVGVYC